MAKLKISLKSDSKRPGSTRYSNAINAGNYKEISLILRDLKNLGLPIDKALKEFNLGKSDWDAALGL